MKFFGTFGITKSVFRACIPLSFNYVCKKSK